MSDDPYKDCLDALMAKMRALEFFNKPHYVSMNHEDVGRGNDYWLILTPGAFPKSRLDSRDVIYNWQTDADLFVRYKTEKESIPKLMEVRMVILKTLHAPRALRNVNVTNVTVSSNDRIKQDKAPPAKPNFLIQSLVISIEQIVKR